MSHTRNLVCKLALLAKLFVRTCKPTIDHVQLSKHVQAMQTWVQTNSMRQEMSDKPTGVFENNTRVHNSGTACTTLPPTAQKLIGKK
jgi:hypothetical protein